MTPSKYIKSQGLPSTAFVADKVGKPVQTIDNWYHNNFALFEVVVAGVLAKDAEAEIKMTDAEANLILNATLTDMVKKAKINERERE